MGCDNREVPPGGCWRGAGRDVGREGGGTARPMSRHVGSVTSPQRDGGSRVRGRGWAGSLWVPGGPGGTCLSAASVMALGTWQPCPPPLSFEAATPLTVGNGAGGSPQMDAKELILSRG